jgi:1,2-diacylglycerol 3-beta-glucosyltransferase
MTIASLVLTLAALPVLAAALYLLATTLLSRRALPVRSTLAQQTRFVIVVPAHNEEAGLPATLQSLAALAYPATHRRVLVIADNCTDRTADIARAHGVEVLERTHDSLRGKGFALEAAIAQLRAEPGNGWDAMVVVDADTDVSPNLLAAAHARFALGAQALQVAYLTRGGSAPLQVVTEVALWASHVIRGRARESVGLSVGLRGNGMVLARSALDRVPYAAFSAVEDLEYGILLAQAGIRVGFVPETVVRGDMPTDDRAVATQRHRWIGGRGAVARDYLVPLLRSAWRQRSAMQLDLALDLALPQISALIMLAALFWPMALLVAALGHALPLVLWSIATLAIAAHVLDAARGAGQLRALVRVAGVLPLYAIRKSILTIRAIVAPTRTWVRTARAGELS